MFSTRARITTAIVTIAVLPALSATAAARSEVTVIGGSALANKGVVVEGVRPPVFPAKSWVIADADTGEVLAAKNAHRRLRPASTLKTLTAITLLPRLDKRDEYKVRWEDAAVNGSAVGVVPGATYTIDELFYGMLLPSGNDAARALASAAGGWGKTVDLMNAKAEYLNALDTTAKNPCGLDADHQLSSAYDLALFARAGLERQDFRRYVGTVTTAFPAEMPKHDKKRDTYQIYNQNPLLLDGYRGAIGVKTGYTTLAGRTFIGAAERGGQTLIVTMMGIDESTDLAAERLLNWGFDRSEQVDPVGMLVSPGDTAHDVKTSSISSSDDNTAAQPAEKGVGWIPLMVAGAGLLLLWWSIAHFKRRPRRAALPRL